MGLGVKVMLTGGGFWLVRRGIMTLFRSLGRHIGTGALDELTLTTNGSQLARYAGELRDCGARVIVSLDTLDPAKLTETMPWPGLNRSTGCARRRRRARG